MEGYLAANTYEFVTSISDYTNAHTFDMTFYFINKDEDPELRYELFKESTVSLAAITMAGSVAFAVDSQSYKVNAGINIDTSSSVTYASNNYYSVSLP